MIQLTFKRTELKYLLTNAQHERLMACMKGRMRGDEWGPSTIWNVYFDTPTNLLARRSLEHPPYKEKLRLRRYGSPATCDSDEVFVELKKKCEGVVYKRRVQMDLRQARELLAGEGHPSGQIEREIDFTARRYGGLAPRMDVVYEREAFFAADDPDFRMTFDSCVRCSWDVGQPGRPRTWNTILPKGCWLLEVKSPGAMPLWLADFLTAEHIFKTSFSKYGRGYELMCAAQGAGVLRAGAGSVAAVPRNPVPSGKARRAQRAGRHMAPAPAGSHLPAAV